MKSECRVADYTILTTTTLATTILATTTLGDTRLMRQRGISLVIALIMLLIMTVIGISAMNTSISKLKMTGGLQQQSTVANNTEQSLVLGERAANSIATNNGQFFHISDNINVNDKNRWKNAASGAGGGNYIIEYLGERVKQGGSLANGDEIPGDTIHVYRITARSEDSRGTTRMFQSLYLSNNGP